MAHLEIAVIIGSLREGSLNRKLALALGALAPADLTFTIVEIGDLPLYNQDDDAHQAESVKQMKAQVARAQGLLFLTPEYNRSISGVLKNALDHLYKEWSGKPAMIVTFGGHGGDRCAAQLREVCTALHMALVAASPGLILPRAQIVANTGEIDPPALFAAHHDQVQQAFGELAAALQTA